MCSRFAPAAALLLAATFALQAAPLSAQGGRSLRFPRFHTDLLVRGDGTLLVTETIRIHFTGSWNGLLREIPVEYEGEYGENYTLFLDVESVTDSAGAPLRWESDRKGSKRVFRVYVPGAQDATHTVVLRYVVENGLRFFEEHDELYWNVTGNDSEYGIDVASARVVLPPEATGIRTAVYTGPRGSIASDASIEVSANQIDYTTTRPLGFREGLTVVAGWDPGAVARPTTMQRVARIVRSNILLLVPVLVFAGMFLLWRRFGRDPRRRPIVPRYEPPADLTPAEVGTLVDATPDLRDVTATLVDLAVRGFVRIEETKEEQLFGLMSNRAFVFHAARSKESWRALKAHERALLEALFGNGSRDSVSTKDLEHSFYKELSGIRSLLGGSLVGDGHYLHHPARVRTIFTLIAVGVAVLVAIGGSMYMASLGQRPTIAIVAAVLTGAVIIGFGLVMPARTVRGTRTLEEILGFQEFLQRVEQDRFERVVRTPEMFEKYLSYAMAFGVEKGWGRAFDDIYRQPPEWYIGPAGVAFHAHAFTGNLGRMATVTGAAMTSAPRSDASSSGFSGSGGGGGFSGGGFGGGGVGGF